MKVLWLASVSIIPGHSAHPTPWIMTLAEALSRMGIQITIVNYNHNQKEKIVTISNNNITLINLKSPDPKIDFLTLYQIRIRTVRKFLKSIISQFDLVHIHGTEHQYEAMAYGLHKNTLISIQGILNEYIKVFPKTHLKQYLLWKLSTFYERMYISKYTYFSCRTHWDSNFVRSINPTASIAMIWEMIREDFFADHYNFSSKTILFVGGKNPIKGLKELLYAFNNSLQKNGFKLIILGNCSGGDIKNIIDTNDLTSIDISNIDCRGMQNVSGIIQAYNDSFCLVHPSYIDNSPNSICEAQLSGLPVIATNVGGVSSLIKNGETGILINRDSNSIEEAVSSLYNDQELWHRISSQSKVVARKRHNPDQIIDQTVTMYKVLMEQKCTY